MKVYCKYCFKELGNASLTFYLNYGTWTIDVYV